MNRIVEQPSWVCFDCAEERGARVPEGHLCTVHTDICGICNQSKTVTEPRDFGKTRYLLNIEFEFTDEDYKKHIIEKYCGKEWFINKDVKNQTYNIMRAMEEWAGVISKRTEEKINKEIFGEDYE